jgi:hypothetical protein
VSETQVTEGSVAEGSVATIAADTGGQTEGQSVAASQTTESGNGNGTGASGESFFDYETIKGKPELEAAYKDMQRAFGRGSEANKLGANKIAQHDQFMANPIDTMRSIAQQNGYQLVQGQPEAGADGEPATFNSWDDVMQEAERRVMANLQPMVGELQNIKRQTVESSLDNAYPDWRTYEEPMMQLLEKYPRLVDDHDMLYRMAVPQEVITSRATKAALRKIQGHTDSGNVQGQSTTTQQPTKSKGKMTFDQAVDFARGEVSKQGLRRPID